MIRQDFTQDLPPKAFMFQVMDNLTKAYCFLWDKKDINHRIRMTLNEVSKYYNMNTFRTVLRKLNNQGLLSYKETKNVILIELVSWDDVMEN